MQFSKEETNRFWQNMHNTYSFTHAEEYLLTRICREMDLIAFMEDEVNLETLRSVGVHGNDIADPLLGEIKQHTALISTLLKQLNLPDSKVMSHSERGKKGNEVRWGERGTVKAS